MKFKLLTTRMMINELPERWHRQYSDLTNKNHLYAAQATKLQTIKNLSHMKASKEKVDKFIGNSSWTDIECCGCGDKVNKAVAFGPDHKKLCLVCLLEAAMVISQKEEDDGEDI